MKNAHKILGMTAAGATLFLGVSRLCHATGTKFYWLLALVLSMAVLFATVLDVKIGTVDGRVYDSVLKYRLASPAPSADVVILDIDEKTLATLAPIYGRWPWQREVFAQAIAELEASEVKGLIVNILFTDADLGHEDSDALLDFVTADTQVTAYPMVRLPAANDEQSQLKASAIPGVTLRGAADPAVAALLPFLAGMQQSMGIANLQADDDGIVRQMSLQHQDSEWEMPTLVGRVLALAGVQPQVDTMPYYLNWRNKRGDYQRVSFSDYMLALNGEGEFDTDFFQGKYVVLGASAPGISSLKPTSINPIMDDNEILATALNDAVQGTYIRLLPAWLMAVVAIAFLILLAALFSAKYTPKKLDLLFTALELLGFVVLFVSVSYSTYFPDMSPMLMAGLAYFVVARLYANLDARVVSGAPEQFKHLSKSNPVAFSVTAFTRDARCKKAWATTHKKLEQEFGLGFVFLVKEPFLSDKVFGALNDIGCLVVVSRDKTAETLVQTVHEQLEPALLEYLQGDEVYDIPLAAQADIKLLQRYMSGKIAHVIGNVDFLGARPSL